MWEVDDEQRWVFQESNVHVTETVRQSVYSHVYLTPSAWHGGLVCFPLHPSDDGGFERDGGNLSGRG